MKASEKETETQVCQGVSHLDEPCDLPAHRLCMRCGLWFCRAHYPDPDWHPCAPEQGNV